MANTSFVAGTTDDEFISQAAQAALAANDYATAAEAAAAAAEAALASTIAALADYLPLAGGTMTGFISLHANPTASLHAATKAYVDAAVAVTSDVYDIGVFFPGTTEDAFQTILLFVAARAFTLPADLDGSEAYAITAPDAETTFTIERNNVEIGTVVFGAGNNEGSFTLSSETDFVAGDTLEIIGPEYADAYLADFSITLRGSSG